MNVHVNEGMRRQGGVTIDRTAFFTVIKRLVWKNLSTPRYSQRIWEATHRRRGLLIDQSRSQEESGRSSQDMQTYLLRWGENQSELPPLPWLAPTLLQIIRNAKSRLNPSDCDHGEL